MPAAKRAKPVVQQRTPRRTGRAGAAARKYPDTSTYEGIAQMSPDKPLTEMQMSFVKLWASGETPLSASIKAGYKDNGSFAYRLVRMPHILAIYNEEKLAYERAGDMNRKKVMDGFLEAVDMARMMSEPTSMVAAWREIGKMCGYYAPVEIKQTITHEGKILVDRMNQLSDDELLRMIEERAALIAQHPDGAANGSRALVPTEGRQQQ